MSASPGIRAPKPVLLPVNAQGIPQVFRAISAWVGWRLAWRDKKWTKEPINLRDGKLAESNNPATWVDFDTAFGNYRRFGCDGIGLCRTADLLFIDLDGVLDHSGALLAFPWAMKILAAVEGKAYIEKSVSRTGLHAICRGTLPPGRREFDIPAPPEHTGFALYDGNRYFTFTGTALPESAPLEDLTGELAKLHGELFPAHNGNNRNGACPAAAHATTTDSDILARARKAKNGVAFSRLFDGQWEGNYQSHSEGDQALCNHLAFWLGRNAGRIDSMFRQSGLYREKWERADYREKTISAAIEATIEVYEPRTPKASGAFHSDREWQIADPGPADPGIAQTRKPETGAVPVIPWPDPLMPAAYHGLAGEIVRMIEPHSEADPVALLMQFLAAFGNVIGRGAHWEVEASTHYTNLFIVIVGATAKGRKGTSWDYIKRVFGAVDSEWCETRQLDGLSTGEGLLWSARDPIKEVQLIKEKGRVVGTELIETDPGVADKRVLVVETEFARVLQVCEREANTLSAILRQAWDSGTLRVLTKKQSATVTGGHISIVGHITKDELCRLLSDTAVANGFANRFMFFCARRSKLLPEGGKAFQQNWAPIMKRLAMAVQFGRTAGLVERDEEARKLWCEIYTELSEGHLGMYGAITARAEAQVMRLACLYALLDCSDVIRREHLGAGLAAWKYCDDSTQFIFGDSMGDPIVDEILRALRARPEGMTRTDISRLFGRNKAASEISRAIGALVERGLVRSEKESESEGRPAERWFAVL